MRAVVFVLSAAACGPSSSPGSCADPIAPGQLVITEVFAQPSDGTTEWFEIYSTASGPLELAGLVITHSRPDGSEAKAHVVAVRTIAPGQYLTLGTLPAAYIDDT